MPKNSDAPGKKENTTGGDNLSSEKLKNVNPTAEAAAPTAPAEAAAPAVSTDAALLSVAERMSPPNPDIENVRPSEEHSDAPEKGFDPEIHESVNGQPVLTPTGRFKKKKGANSRRLHIPESENDEQKRAKMVAAQRLMAATVVVDSFINTGVMVFGQEWLPETQKILDPTTQKELGVLSERETLITTTEQYMAAKGINDIPPGVCLALVVSAYCLKRTQKPETQKRLIAIFGGIKGKVLNLFNRVKGMFARKK